MRLQWTDHDGRVHSGQPDDVMRLAYQAGQHHTTKPSRMFIPKDYLTKESTMFTPSTPTATMSCTGCDNITTFGFDGVLGIDYCRECGSIAGYPFGTAPQSAAQPTPPAPAPRRAESLAHLVEETEVERAAFGAWRKNEGTWCIGLETSAKVDVPRGSVVSVRKRNGTTAPVKAGATIKYIENRNRETADEFPFVAIIAVGV